MKVITSALRRLAAASKLTRVRVESSKNMLATVRPRRVGSLGTARVATSAMSSARSRMPTAVARSRSRTERRCLTLPPSFRPVDGDRVFAVGLAQPHEDALGDRRRQVLAHEVGADRQLAMAAVDQHGEAHRARPAEVVQGVERRADGAARVEDVVDQHDGLAVDPAGRHAGRARRAGRLIRQVVAVHRDVEGADGARAGLEAVEDAGDPLREDDTPRWGCREGRDRSHHGCSRGSRARCGSTPA